jgi:hypothetical protein
MFDPSAAAQPSPALLNAPARRNRLSETGNVRANGSFFCVIPASLRSFNAGKTQEDFAADFPIATKINAGSRHRHHASSMIARIGPPFGTAAQDSQQIRIVVQFKAVRSLGTPRPSDTPWWGGLRFRQKFCRGPFREPEGNVLRQCCDACGFKQSTIEIMARQMVARALEPQKLTSGRPPGLRRCGTSEDRAKGVTRPEPQIARAEFCLAT